MPPRTYRRTLPRQTGPVVLTISVDNQRMQLRRGGKLLRSYPISTSRYGLGSEEGSNRTPLGRFRISDKIGAAMPRGTIFRERKPVQGKGVGAKKADLVMTRILWLDGLDEHNANTHARYIYIHGTNHENKIGHPASHGCVRMRNSDIEELFDLVEVGTPVAIRPSNYISKRREKRCVDATPRLKTRSNLRRKGAKYKK